MTSKYFFRGIALSLCVLALSSTPSRAETIAISTLPSGAILNLQSQIIGKVVQGHTDLQVRVIPVAGTTATHAALQNGDAEFTLGDVSNMSDALRGVREFKDLKPMKDLRVVLKMQDFPIGIMVRNDSGIKTLKDLKGKKFPTGFQAFPNLIPLCNGVLGSVGLSLDDIDGVVSSGLIPAADDFKTGKTVGTCIALPAPKVREVDAAIPGGVRFLSMDNSPEAVKRVQAVRPDYGVGTVQPSPSFPGILAPTNVLIVYNLVVTSAKVKDDVVYKFAKAMAENKGELVKGHPQFGAFFPDARMAQKFNTVEYHPGAIKYLKERGFWK